MRVPPFFNEELFSNDLRGTDYWYQYQVLVRGSLVWQLWCEAALERERFTRFTIKHTAMPWHTGNTAYSVDSVKAHHIDGDDAEEEVWPDDSVCGK